MTRTQSNPTMYHPDYDPCMGTEVENISEITSNSDMVSATKGQAQVEKIALSTKIQRLTNEHGTCYRGVSQTPRKPYNFSPYELSP